MTGSGRPTLPVVVFVDDQSWMSFSQLSASLRKHRVRTARITTDASRLSRLESRAHYGWHTQVDSLESDELVAALRAVPGQVRDVMCREGLLARVRAAGDALDSGVREHLGWRERLSDKQSVSELLSGHGVPVAELLPLDVVCAEDVDAVLKPRRGSGGAGVRRVRSAAEARAVLADLPADDYLAERALPGEGGRYGAVFDAAGPIVECAYLVGGRRSGEFGPTHEIASTADPEVLELGRAVVAAVGGRGLLSVETRRDDDGHARVHDVNARAWHSTAAMSRVAAPMTTAYLATLGLRERPGRVVAAPGAVEIYPWAALAEIERSRARAASMFLQTLPGAVRDFGSRSVLLDAAVFARAATSLTGRRGHRRRLRPG